MEDFHPSPGDRFESEFGRSERQQQRAMLSFMRAGPPLLLLASVTAVGAIVTHWKNDGPSGLEDEFADFILRHKRSYAVGSEEYHRRLPHFARRFHEVRKHNRREDRLWTAGLTHLADWTDAEFARVRGWKGAASPSRGQGPPEQLSQGLSLSQTGRAEPLPEEWLKWVNLAALFPIRDQGSCGSCWAISSTTVLGAHEEIWRKERGVNDSFSTQELVSCVPNPDACGGTGGCDGATAELAFNYIMQHGLVLEDMWPYRAVSGVCSSSTSGALTSMLSAIRGAFANQNANNAVVDAQEGSDLASPGIRLAQQQAVGLRTLGIKGWERLPENKYEPLLRALVESGPVAVSVSASSWANYESGIFDDCGKDAIIDHAVTLVGYGKQKAADGSDVKYWLIQNSWGESWGENGRIRLLRKDGEEKNHCGVDNQPQLGTGCKGGPAKVRVCGMCGILYDSVVPLMAKAPTTSV